VVLGDHVGLPVGAGDDRPRGQEDQSPHPGPAGGGQQWSDIHSVRQDEEGGFDVGQRCRQRVGFGQIALDNVDFLGEPGPLRGTGQRPHRRTRGSQLLYRLASEVARGTDNEIHEGFPFW